VKIQVLIVEALLQDLELRQCDFRWGRRQGQRRHTMRTLG